MNIPCRMARVSASTVKSDAKYQECSALMVFHSVRDMVSRLASAPGRWLAHYLSQPIRRYQAFAVSDPGKLAGVLRPADILLVDGNSRVSTAIKYLTQSTWSHVAMYAGDFGQTGLGPEAAPVLVEADLEQGVIAVPLGKYALLNTRICRPVGLSEADSQRVCDYVIGRIGHAYDLKNIVDLARYLLPVPPVPVYWRRRMLELGSGDPTRAICSTLIAQAFQSVRYPILPHTENQLMVDDESGSGRRQTLRMRHSSLFTPRDFDVSPWFRIIKPTLEGDFDYRMLAWADQADNR